MNKSNMFGCDPDFCGGLTPEQFLHIQRNDEDAIKVDFIDLNKKLELSNAKVEWLNNLYVTWKVSHPHMTPDYPGDEKCLGLFRKVKIVEVK